MVQIMKRLCIAVFALLLTWVPIKRVIGAEGDDQELPGLAVGKQVPDFVLKDQAGAEQSLAALLKKGPVAVVFYRSADW